jgi:hypothetical protein
LLFGQIRIAGLFDRAAVRVKDTGILPGCGDPAHALVKSPRVLRLQIAHRCYAEEMEVLQHFFANAPQVLQLNFGRRRPVSHRGHSNLEWRYEK